MLWTAGDAGVPAMYRLIIFSLLLTGCGGVYFSKAGSTEQDWQRDYYECRLQASGIPRRPMLATAPREQGLNAVANMATLRDETELLDMCLIVKGWVKQ